MNMSLIYYNLPRDLRRRVESLGDELITIRPTIARWLSIEIATAAARSIRQLSNGRNLTREEWFARAHAAEEWLEVAAKVAAGAAAARLSGDPDRVRLQLEDMAELCRDVQSETLPEKPGDVQTSSERPEVSS
jgi:alkanesulfonate monooxygenase SsuD/methylene tetrahydromethanopterin reductase-like flavin-dependent oxidoreductase (luciferase family)